MMFKFIVVAGVAVAVAVGGLWYYWPAEETELAHKKPATTEAISFSRPVSSASFIEAHVNVLQGASAEAPLQHDNPHNTSPASTAVTNDTNNKFSGKTSSVSDEESRRETLEFILSVGDYFDTGFVAEKIFLFENIEDMLASLTDVEKDARLRINFSNDFLREQCAVQSLPTWLKDLSDKIGHTTSLTPLLQELKFGCFDMWDQEELVYAILTLEKRDSSSDARHEHQSDEMAAVTSSPASGDDKQAAHASAGVSTGDEADVAASLSMHDELGLQKEIHFDLVWGKVDDDGFVVENSESVATSERVVQLLENAKKAVRLRVSFPSDSILKHDRDEFFFRNWLVRVGDYIHARRLVLADEDTDFNPILLNAELLPSRAHAVDKRGYALFSVQRESWTVEFRGLEEHAHELNTLLHNILLPALTKPESLALCSKFATKKVSQQVTDDCKKTLTAYQEQMTDAFFRMLTFTQEMKDARIKRNLGACMPLTKFTGVQGSDELENARIKFIHACYSRFIFGIDENGGEVTEEKLLKMINANKPTNYNWLCDYLIAWAQKSNISQILLDSLFIREH